MVFALITETIRRKITLHHRVAGPREITATMRHHLSPPTALMMMTILGALINYIIKKEVIKWVGNFVLFVIVDNMG
jgi:hypothetical protein